MCISTALGLSAATLAALETHTRLKILQYSSTLNIQVFSRTDAEPKQYVELEKQLRALPNLRNMEVISPEEALRRLDRDPYIDEEIAWLKKKSAAWQGRRLILPWTYLIQLKSWEDEDLENALFKIQEIHDVPSSAVGEVYWNVDEMKKLETMKKELKKIRIIFAAIFICVFLLAAHFFYRNRGLLAVVEIQEELGWNLSVAFLLSLAIVGVVVSIFHSHSGFVFIGLTSLFFSVMTTIVLILREKKLPRESEF